MKELLTAWNVISSDYLSFKSSEDVDPQKVFFWLPVIGLGMGVVFASLALLINFVVPSTTLPAIFGSIVIAACYIAVCGGKRAFAFIRLLERFFRRKPATGDEDIPIGTYLTAIVLQVGIVAFLLGAGLLIFNDKITWFIVIPLLSASTYAHIFKTRYLQGQVSGGEQEQENGRLGKYDTVLLWALVALITILVTAPTHLLLAAILASLVGWLAATVMYPPFAREMGDAVDSAGWSAVLCADLIILWIGVLG